MRIGVLDIGSHSAQLLVVDATPGAPPLPVRALKQSVALDPDIDRAGVISPAGARRVVEAVTRVIAAARRYDVDSCYAFVTASIRDAPNREDVLDEIEDAVTIRPQFLTGVQEAELTYLAVRHWYGWRVGTVLVLDIGGGTMELAMGRDARPAPALSLPLGAGLLTRAFLAGDPPTRRELRALRRHIRHGLKEVRDQLLWAGPPHRVIGSSKIIEQLARLSGAAPRRDGPFVTRALTRAQVRRAIRTLRDTTTEERTRLPGVSRTRARQLLAGAMVAEATMRTLRIDRLEISPWALREGVVLQHLSRIDPTDYGLPLRPFALPPESPEPSLTAIG